MSDQLVQKAYDAARRKERMAYISLFLFFFFGVLGGVALGFATANAWWGVFFFAVVGIAIAWLIGRDT